MTGPRPTGALPSFEVRLRAALEGGDHRDALRLLMAEHGAAVYGFCARTVADRELAADVQQQVFEEAYRDLGSLQKGESARSWLFGIARHRCLDAIKARRRWVKRFEPEASAVEDVEAEPHDPAERVDAGVMARAIDECIRGLSAEARMAVLLRFQEGISYEDMGRICREKAGTLQARVARALPLLRRCLEGKGIFA